MLETLSEVQAFDLQRDALIAEREAVPEGLLSARATYERLSQALNAVRTEHDDLRRRVNTLELDLSALTERRKQAADSALRASSNKEMAQFQNQELQFANRAQELEEDTLPLMEELEGLANTITELEGELATHQPTLESLEAAERERIAGIDLKSADLTDRRDRLCTDIDAGVLKVYEQVRRARRGLALVGLEGNQRCGGCHVQLPIHVVQKVKRGVGVTRCPSCGRMLHAVGAAG